MKKRTTRPKGLSRRGVISALAAAGRWEERTGVERQGRQAGRPTGQEARVGLRKGTETARSAREIVRGEAGLKKRQGN